MPLSFFQVVRTFAHTTVKIAVDTMNKEAEYRITHRNVLVDIGQMDRLQSYYEAVDTPELAERWIADRIEGIDLSCRIVAATKMAVGA